MRSLFASALLLAVALPACRATEAFNQELSVANPNAAGAAPCRDRRKQPFNSSSVWNTAIGSNASYVHAQIYTNSFNHSWACELRVTAPSRRRQCPTQVNSTSPCPPECCTAPADEDPSLGWLTCFKAAGSYPDEGMHADQDLIIFAEPGDPLTPFLDRAWVGEPHCCDVSGPQKGELPFPVDFVTDCELNNNAAALLAPDNVTLYQFQPLYRGTPGSPIMAQWPPTCPYPFIAGWNISILGDGAHGAHGGSFLSSIGGTVRGGELLPDAPPMAHALKIELYAHDYYWAGWSGPACYRWPALACDGYVHSSGDQGYNGTVPAVAPGALLAIPPSLAPAVAANLTTLPAQKLLWTLVNYGAYLVDDTAGDSGSLCMEPAAIADLQSAYGISMNISHAAFPTSTGPTGAFFFDMVTLFQALYAVENNGPDAPGGGGTPMQPTAAPLCP